MKAEQLRKSILQLAIQGKLVKQDPNDEPASVLLERIRAEKQRLIKEGKIKKDKGDSIIFKGDDNCYYEKIGSEIKNIEDEIDFDLPDGWEWVRICSISKTVTKGTTPRGGNVAYQADGVGFLRAENVAGLDKLDLSNLKYIDLNTHKNALSRSILEVNDILITIAGTLGRTAIVSGSHLPLNANQAVSIVRLVNAHEINLKYIVFALNAPSIAQSLIGQKKITAIPNLTLEIIANCLLPIPPIAEQERIVKEIERFEPLLAEYDKLEQKATKLDNEIYDKLKKSILQYAIQGKLVEQDKNDEPASILLERIRAEKKAQLGKKYVESYIYKGDDNCYYEKIGKNEPVLVEDLPFDIPDTWMWARLGCIGDWGAGATPARGNPEYYDGNIPWIKTGELNNSYVFSSEETITLKALNECSLRYNKKGDVLIAMYGATIGKLAIAGIDLTTNQACCACTPQSGINNLYLFYLLMAEKDRFVKMGAGGAQPNISREKIVTHIVPIPPYSEQLKIVNAIKYILKHIEKDEI